MSSKLLTVLGCSSSIALTLLSNSPAKANGSVEYVFTAPTAEGEIADVPASDKDYPFYDCSCSEYDPEMIEKFDRESDKAIELYGCDCAGCIRLVRNLQQTAPIN